MIFRQFVDEDLGCASYLVGDGASGEALVVDPAFAIEQYLDAAAGDGLRIVRVLETHTHADHVSGHGRFALEHGVPVSIHPLAGPEYAFDPIADGDAVAVGSVETRVVHTPGHRPEHCAFVVAGELALTGDSLFVLDSARPDLAVDARSGAADLYRSLHRLAELPDAVVVYPGHVAGSLCGTNMSDEHWTSIGREKASNLAFDLDERSFVDATAAVTTPRPPTTELVVALNRGPWVAARPPLEPVAAGDTTVLDVRTVEAFAAGHVPDAISVALHGGSFATRAAFVIAPDEPVAIHAETEAEARAAARGLWSVGLHETRGYLAAPVASERTAAIDVSDFAELVDDVQVLDVRAEREWADGILPGALRVPYRTVGVAPLEEIDCERPVYTICVSGARATLAASLLARRGYDARPVIGGGIEDVRRAAARTAARSR